jgi:transcriptional regulator with XRE-family HTH domain
MLSALKTKRLERGLSQFDLFRKTDVGPWRISQFERGLYPHKDEAEKIAQALDAPITDLFPALAQGVQR